MIFDVCKHLPVMPLKCRLLDYEFQIDKLLLPQPELLTEPAKLQVCRLSGSVIKKLASPFSWRMIGAFAEI